MKLHPRRWAKSALLTFGSLLIQGGASLAYVKEQMGHSSIQVTVDIYGHLIPGAGHQLCRSARYAHAQIRTLSARADPGISARKLAS